MTSAFLRIAEDVLAKQSRAMSAREIIEVAEREQLLPDSFTGATPHQTLKSKLSVAIRRDGEESKFARTAPGRFVLRAQMDGQEVYDAPRAAPPPAGEDVLGVRSSSLDECGRFDGIKISHKRYLAKLLKGGLLAQERYSAERDDDFKQIITYVLVTRGDSLLAYRRGAFNRVEHFLRGSDCVGFGGHVTAGDLNLFSQADSGITAGAVRELAEELKLPATDLERLHAGEGLEVIGLLNDDSSPVGRRHLAVVYRYEVSGDQAWNRPTRGEKAITKLRWITPGSGIRLNDFEYWSQLCLRTFHKVIAHAQPEIRARRTGPFKPPHILCVVGQIGSGKSEATDLLRSERGYASVNSGQAVARILGLPNVTEDQRLAFQAAAQEFISDRSGPRRLAEEIVRCASKADSDRVVVDGIRQQSTLSELKRAADRRVAVLYVHTPPDVALGLYSARSGEDVSMVEFAAIRESQVEQEVPSFLSFADAVLFNWEGRSKYRDLVRRFVDQPALLVE